LTPGHDVQPSEVEAVGQHVGLLRHGQRHQDQGRLSGVVPDDLGHPEVKVGPVLVLAEVGRGQGRRLVRRLVLPDGAVGDDPRLNRLVELLPTFS